MTGLERERRATRLASIVTCDGDVAVSHLRAPVSGLGDVIALRDAVGGARRATRPVPATTAASGPTAPFRDAFGLLGRVSDRLVLAQPAVLERYRRVGVPVGLVRRALTPPPGT